MSGIDGDLHHCRSSRAPHIISPPPGDQDEDYDDFQIAMELTERLLEQPQYVKHEIVSLNPGQYSFYHANSV